MRAVDSVCAIVVTYNRVELLRSCLDHLAAQSRPPDRVLVVDNASTDETADVLAARDDVEVLRLEVNGGGAGGFAAGLEHAFGDGHDWFWLLDDDTLADAECLRTLLDGVARAPRPPRVMASTVRWRDGRLHPMNAPWMRMHRRGAFAEGAGAGLVAIRATTFVSALVHRDAVAQFGLPPAHFFVWLDDIEFTGRVLREGEGYLVPESVAWHWTPRPHSTLSDARDRFYYKARNHLWLLRGDAFGGLEWLGYAAAYVRGLVVYLRTSPNRRAAARTAWRGVRDGLRPIPR
jgi:GT2 family glycosyltransferase